MTRSAGVVGPELHRFSLAGPPRAAASDLASVEDVEPPATKGRGEGRAAQPTARAQGVSLPPKTTTLGSDVVSQRGTGVGPARLREKHMHTARCSDSTSTRCKCECGGALHGTRPGSVYRWVVESFTATADPDPALVNGVGSGRDRCRGRVGAALSARHGCDRQGSRGGAVRPGVEVTAGQESRRSAGWAGGIGSASSLPTSPRCSAS